MGVHPEGPVPKAPPWHVNGVVIRSPMNANCGHARYPGPDPRGVRAFCLVYCRRAWDTYLNAIAHHVGEVLLNQPRPGWFWYVARRKRHVCPLCGFGRE
jgi:hypothetical protein